MTLSQITQTKTRRAWVAFLAFAACTIFVPAAAHAQACTVNVTLALTSQLSGCSGSIWTVSGTETAGNTPGANYNFVNTTNPANGSSTQTIQGVCAYSYLPCNGDQPASTVTVPTTNPTATSQPTVVSTGKVLTVTVQETGFSAVASTVPCQCTDASPQGYAAVTMGPTTFTQETFNATCN
jgi:hypothetical protein